MDTPYKLISYCICKFYFMKMWRIGMVKPFEGVLGNNSELRTLEFLLPLHDIEFNITELAGEVGVSRVTATRIVKKFIEWGIMNSTKKAGILNYSLNQESPIVKNIEQLNNIIIEHILGDEILYEIYDFREKQRICNSIRFPTVGDSNELSQQQLRKNPWPDPEIPIYVTGWPQAKQSNCISGGYNVP